MPNSRWSIGASLLSPIFVASLSVALMAGVPAQDAVAKSSYTLFQATPVAQLRELSTDRPDQTESPYTVDAGHFQVELSFVTATFDTDRSNGGKVRTRAWDFGSINLKAGLLNNVDLQFVLDPYVDSRSQDRVTGRMEKGSGFGDAQTRLKINLWGNDGVRTALAIMPYVKWPLSRASLRNGKTEGGIIIPLAIKLAAGWSATVMTEVDFVHDEGGGYRPEFINSISCAHGIAGSLGGYIEFFSVINDGPGWIGQVDVGFTYALNEHSALDFGCNCGVTKAAPDFNPFVGYSIRF